MPTSTIPAFKTALITRLAARAGLTGVQITYGFPVRPEREWICVWGTRAADPTGGTAGGQRSAPMGQQRREERYVLEIIVSVTLPLHESQQTVTERAFTLAAEIETSLREWATATPRFGGIVRWAQVTDMAHSEPADAQDREARVSIDVACAERI